MVFVIDFLPFFFDFSALAVADLFSFVFVAFFPVDVSLLVSKVIQYMGLTAGLLDQVIC